MAVAFLQEFKVRTATRARRITTPSQTSSTSRQPPDGLIAHTAGFDHDRGVFRIFDVWESRDAGQRFMDGKLMPIIERMSAEGPAEEFAPPTADYWYELHDTMS